MKINKYNIFFSNWKQGNLSPHCACSFTLRWRHNGHDSDSNHQPHGCLREHLFRRISRKTSKLLVTGLCVGNSLGTGEFPAQMASNAENVSIWWRHHDTWDLQAGPVCSWALQYTYILLGSLRSDLPLFTSWYPWLQTSLSKHSPE